jgi:hypothetical protein
MAARPLRVALLALIALAVAAIALAVVLRPGTASIVEAPAGEPGAAPAATIAADATPNPLGAAPAESALMGVVEPEAGGAAQSVAPAASVDAQALGWSAWQDLGGVITSAPAPVSWGAGRIDLFARGGNGEVVQNARDGAGAWTGWATPGELRGVVLRSAPACTSAALNTINCVALREGYGGVFQFWWDGQRWSRNDLGGDATSAPAIVAWGGGRLSVFVRNTNGSLIHKYWQPGAADWSPPQWEAVGNGAQLFSAPSCTSRDVGVIDCFALGPSGVVQQLYYDEAAGEGRRWVGWNQLVGVASFRGASAVSAVGSGRNLLDLFVRGLDTRLYQITYTGSWITPWLPVDSRMSIAAPGCARVGRNRLDCFGQFVDTQSDAYFGVAPGLQYRYLQRP